MNYAIETLSLTKKFGDFKALNDLNLQVEKGEIYGLLGPNRAGKTTTIKILSGLLVPTSGEAYVHENLIPDKKIASSIGYMAPGNSTLHRFNCTSKHGVLR